jgi:hypothetical protein
VTGPEQQQRETGRDGQETAPALTTALGLARFGMTVGRRALSWTSDTTLRTGQDVLARIRNGDPPVAIAEEVTKDLREAVQAALGEDAVKPAGESEVVEPEVGLRTRGQALLEESAKLSADTGDDREHPAYARILSEITPDEARVLRLLFRSGAQPALDIRTNRPLGIGSELIADGLNMIGEYAGLRYLDRIHPYLTNLNRLGLVLFSKEQVEDPERYQLIEAQPDVSEAMAKAGRAPKLIYRSIRLTSFGRDFCEICFPPFEE